MWAWLYDEKRVISASRPPRSRVIQPWISNKKTLPTPSARRSTHNTPVLLNGEARAPSQPPANPAGTKTWAACSREHSNQQSPHDLQPEQLLRRFHKAYPPNTPQSARLRATIWGTSSAPVLPVARQRLRRRASRSSLRRSAGLGVGQSAGPTRSAAAKRPEPPSSTTTRSLPEPGQPQPCGRSSKQQSNERLAALLAKQHYRQDRLTTVRTTSA